MLKHTGLSSVFGVKRFLFLRLNSHSLFRRGRRQKSHCSALNISLELQSGKGEVGTPQSRGTAGSVLCWGAGQADAWLCWPARWGCFDKALWEPLAISSPSNEAGLHKPVFAPTQHLLWFCLGWIWVLVFSRGTWSRHPRVVTHVWSWGRTTCLCQWLLLWSLSRLCPQLPPIPGRALSFLSPLPSHLSHLLLPQLLFTLLFLRLTAKWLNPAQPPGRGRLWERNEAEEEIWY